MLSSSAHRRYIKARQWDPQPHPTCHPSQEPGAGEGSRHLQQQHHQHHHKWSSKWNMLRRGVQQQMRDSNYQIPHSSKLGPWNIKIFIGPLFLFIQQPPKRCSSSRNGITGSSNSSSNTHSHGVWPSTGQHIFFWEPSLASSAFDGKFLFPKSIFSVIYVYSLPFISKQESQDEEELPEEGRGGQTPGVGSQLSSQSGARPRGPRSASQGRRRQQRGVHQRPSQRAPDSDGEDGGIDVDRLIDLVREREPLWNMADRRHADLIVTRRLWEEICLLLVGRWEDLDVRAQIKERNRIVNRWRSVRDRFKKEFNKEMRAPSGSGGRRSKYKYAQALSFLRETMLTRR
ncbi:uncharacterized protein [Dendrobates tinctorius]|uniref:uncharacterized protein isoform X1 n=1 Tax=Dendrobates tinctorius TaxID=92724 RepID=UPI003CC9E846